MYLLENISLHQWYLAQAEDIPMRGATAIIGKTGAGKSSFLDAVQVVISGNNRHVQKLNAAAGERRDRSVRDYAMGCVSDVDAGKPLRGDGLVETTLALCFRDEATGKTVSIGLLIEVDPHGQGEETRRFVAEGYAFRIADFVRRDDAGREVMAPHDQMIATMRAACRPGCFELPQNARRYVADYLARMRPGVPPDADRFLRVFGNSMLPDDVTDPTTFVRRYILDPLPLDVERVKESVRNWRALEAEVARIESMIDAIKPVRERLGTGLRLEVEAQTEAWALAHIEVLQAGDQLATYQGEQAEAAASLREVEHEVEQLEGVAAMLDEDVRTFRAIVGGDGRAAEIETARADERAGAAGRRAGIAALSAAVAPHADLAHLQGLRAYLPRGDDCTQSLAVATTLRAATLRNPADTWPAQIPELAALCASSRGLLSAGRGLEAQDDALGGELLELGREAAGLEEVLRTAGSTGGPVLSVKVSAFVGELRRRGIACTVVAEVVDVADPEWAFALESVLGANCEAVIVAEGDVERAHEVMQANRQNYWGCFVVEPRKLRGRAEMSLMSLAGVARTDHPIARRFIDDKVGRFVRAETEADLARHNYAIMRNGKSTGGSTRTVARGDRKLVLGRVAQQANLEQSRARLAEIRALVGEKSALRGLLGAARTRLLRLGELDAGAVEAALSLVWTADTAMAAALNRRHMLESQGDEGVAENLREAEAELARARLNITATKARMGDAREFMGGANTLCRNAQATLEALLGVELALSEAAQGARTLELVALLDCTGSTIDTRRARIANEQAFRPENARDRGQYLRRAHAEAKARVDAFNKGEKNPRAAQANASTGLLGFLKDYSTADIDVHSADVVSQYRWAVAREQGLALNQLLPHKRKVAVAREAMETSLREDLLTRLAENFDELDRQIRGINRRLEAHTFVGQRYRFSRSLNAGMKPLYALVRKASQGEQPLVNLMRGDGEVDVDEVEMGEARRRVEAILSGDEGALAFDDYREYYQFEMELIARDADGNELPPAPYSRIVGKLSGGQKQAPYYVAIAASMVSAYYPARGRVRGGEEGMGLILFDEGFSKLDVVNSQALVAFFRALGLQILVAATEEKRATVRESVDTMITVMRRENSRDLFVDSVTIGARARQAMLEQNPVYSRMGSPAVVPANRVDGDDEAELMAALDAGEQATIEVLAQPRAAGRRRA